MKRATVSSGSSGVESAEEGQDASRGEEEHKVIMNFKGGRGSWGDESDKVDGCDKVVDWGNCQR